MLMKKLLLTLAALLITLTSFAFPKAFYVVKDDSYTKYNFGVAGDLKFSADGKTLSVTGYDDAIILDEIDYITFTAPVMPSLTPAAQKEKLVKIGEKVNSMVDINKYADMVAFVDCFFREFDVDNYNWHRSPSQFEIDPKYWDVHNAFNKALKGAEEIIKLNAAGSRAVRTAAVDLYRMSDYYGVFEADRTKEEWVKVADATDKLEFRFATPDGTDKFVFTLKAADAGSNWITKDFELLSPETINISFARNDKEIASGVIKSTFVQDKSIVMTFDFNSNGLTVNNVLNITNDLITDNVDVKIDNKQLALVNSTVEGRNLLDYDQMYDAVKSAMHRHDENGKCIYSDMTALYPHFIRAKADVDVIGELQLKSKFSGLSKVYPRLSEEADIYNRVTNDKGHVYTYGKVISQKDATINTTRYDMNTVTVAVNALNDYFDVTFHYDGTSDIQGYLAWEIGEDSYENYMDPNEEWSQNIGYAILDGQLIFLERDYNYDPNSGDYTPGEWYYYVYTEHDDDEEYTEPTKVVVADKDVLRPETIREIEYFASPLLGFPDQTSFDFGSFFDRMSFKSLIDDVDGIVDTYFSITGQTRDPEDHL